MTRAALLAWSGRAQLPGVTPDLAAEVLMPGALAVFVYLVSVAALVAGRRLAARPGLGARGPRLRVLQGGAVPRREPAR